MNLHLPKDYHDLLVRGVEALEEIASELKLGNMREEEQ